MLHERVDLLINNAGVMAPPSRTTTRDGFGLQFGTSLLALLMFALEWQQRSDAAGWGLLSPSAHPGCAHRTDCRRLRRGGAPATTGAGAGPLISQSAAAGVLATRFAATSPDATGGGYFGPDGLYELKGAPPALTGVSLQPG